MTRSRTRTTLAALAAGAVLLTAGCGVSATDDAATGPQEVVIGGSGTSGAAEAGYLSQAAEATGAVKTQKMALEMTMDGLPTGTVTITSEGAFDNESGRGRMTMDMGAAFEGGMGPDDALPEGAGVMEMVVDGDIVYVKSPLFSMMGDSDKPWIKVDARELGSGDVGLGGSATADPAAFLDFLEGAGTVEEVGTEEIRGVPTTHLEAEIDFAKLLAEAGGDQKAEMEQQLEGLGADLESFDSLPVEAWVDEDGYVRKFAMTFDFGQALKPSDDMGDMTMTMTIELYDFDEPVDIEIPPASQVGEMGAGLFGELDGGD